VSILTTFPQRFHPGALVARVLTSSARRSTIMSFNDTPVSLKET